MHFEHAEAGSALAQEPASGDDSGIEVRFQQEESHTPFVRDGRKVGRNEPCPCGSGKKYKHCHGQLD